MAAAARPGKDEPALLLDLRIEGAPECGGGGGMASQSSAAPQRNAHVLPAGSGSTRSRGPPLLLEHGFFRGLPGWGGPGTGGAWEDAQLEGATVAVPALRDAFDVRHFDSRCVVWCWWCCVGVGSLCQLCVIVFGLVLLLCFSSVFLSISS